MRGLLRRQGWSTVAIGRFAFVASLLFAVLATAVSGVVVHRNLNPEPAATIRVGEAIEVGGVRYTVDRFDAVPELPNAEQGEPPVAGPEGSSIVVAVVTVQLVDPAVDPELVFCSPEVRNAEGTVWRRDGSLYGFGGVPDHLTCQLPEPEEEGDPAWPRDKPFQLTALFLLPADMVADLTLHLQVTDDPRNPDEYAYAEVLVVP